ncbi:MULTISPECIES: RIP metalloprotease RseP [unclassified Campylobacter]|uniref:RIP metalloprotease RseP n=1 Tax=unclassified Campylobacter TaxID=2593542 RepID=UPI0022E9FFC6|nr:MULTISPECIES: RIP metalloprotease RseP [unclassified Campylobacter]MDA3042947.1 RIP metalloprotease RseP [Campylobacter sp. JMF_09 ED2]MDA3044218.1 RIP metalloprotease RseP [Campylobacter sp. JMF_07 ED4]MDA3063567.1 RIP metalloprotease RseP [Campylobacter sp. JMF_11 EL3]MDA3071193.1 RIP metalloprotease RseP [Campylobacter sp. VBCF_03 NA9]MDA3074653.1 RIP metalloprotease RseP [Campylobacter sp. JMF_05 ED3]
MKSILLTIGILLCGLYFYGLHFFVTILAISFLIFFHELGHFSVARLLGVGVNVFSVGFGEKIYTKQIGATQYCISAIPLGGYVSLKGQEDLDPSAKNFDPDSYNTKGPLARIAILVAGPAFNIILAFLIYISLGYIGVERIAPIVGAVSENSAAQSAGIMVGDEILSINGAQIREWDDISKNVVAGDLNLQIKRAGEIKNLNLTPKMGEKLNIWRERIQTPLIGISPGKEPKYITLYHTGASSLGFALDETIQSSKIILVGLEKLVSGVVSPKEMGGIVAITDITTKAVSYGASVVLLLVALISVNLGIINLFPIPALDGGHILFNLIELVFRRPVPEKVFIGASYAGIAILAMLMIFTIVNDFARMLGFYQ